MGQPSDPGSDPAERRWTIWKRNANEFRRGRDGLGVEGPDTVPVEVMEVPAGGLVAELEVERARRERAEAALRPFAEAYAAVNYTFCPAFAGPESLAAFDGAVAIMNGEPAERSAVPTATVSEDPKGDQK